MRSAAAALLLAAAWTWAEPAAAAGFTFGPAVVSLEVPAGALGQTTLLAANGTDVPLEVSARVVDWWVEDGRTVLADQSDRLDSALGWTVLSSDRFVLGAGQDHRLQVYVQPPAGATGGYYAAVRISAAPLGTDGVATGGGVGGTALLAVRIEGTGLASLSLAGVSATAPTDTTPLVVSARVTASGDVFTELLPTVLVVDASGRTIVRVDGDPVRFRPGQVKDVPVRWTGSLSPGAYTLVFSGVYGDGQTLADTGTLTLAGP